MKEETAIVHNNEAEITAPGGSLALIEDKGVAKNRAEIIARGTSKDMGIGDCIGVGAILTGLGAAVVLLIGGAIQLIYWDFYGLFNLITTSILIGGGAIPFATGCRLGSRRRDKILAKPLNKAGLALAKKIETHNLRLEAYRVGNFTGEEKTAIKKLLAAEKENIIKRIGLLKKARAAEAMAKKLRANPSLPMTDEIDMLLAAGIALQIEEMTNATDMTELLDEQDFPPQLTA